MTKDTLLNEVHVTPDVRHTFHEIREAVKKATSQEDLTELYKQAAYMILMTHSSPIDDNQDKDLRRRRENAEREFSRTVHLINKQAKKIGMEANYSENWREMSTNGYESKGKNTLEGHMPTEIAEE